MVATEPSSFCKVVWPHYALKLAVLGIAFLGWTATYSFLIPAWETNDELDHVANIEYAVKQPLTFMPIQYEHWHETHQPPMYYWLGSAWQQLWGIPPFDVSFPPWRSTRSERGKLILAHDKFDNIQREQVIALHKLRLISPVFGLMTVILTFFCALQVIPNDRFALSAAVTAALHPKLLIISAAITNDSLAVAVGSAFLFLVLKYVSREGSAPSRLFLSLGIGVTAGVAVLTKLNILPIVGSLIPIALIFAPYRWRIKLIDFAIILCSAFSVSGWWLIHNQLNYGDSLAARASNVWLTARLPRIIHPVSYFDSERVLDFVPQNLFRTLWYNGGWNQNVAPFAFYFALWCFAAPCLFGSCKAQFLVPTTSFPPRKSLCVWTSALAGLFAVFLIAQQTVQAEGRIALPALSAFSFDNRKSGAIKGH